MTDSAVGPPALSINGLTVTLPGGRRLFHQAALIVQPREFVLLVGVSGSGKSTLLNLIAGLNDSSRDGPSVSGTISLFGSDSRASVGGHVGIVFQSLALFDELSAEANVQFALDHRRQRGVPVKVAAAELLTQFGVPVGTPLADLSGGERQRVAVARTLALDPPLLLFDEPIAGLDPLRARAVADSIADTHRRFQKTVVVVSHDFEPFLQHAPRLVLLEPHHGRLEEITERRLHAYFEARAGTPPESEGRQTDDGPISAMSDVVAGPRPPRPSTAEARPLGSRALWAMMEWVEQPGQALWLLLYAAVAPFQAWRRPKWKLRYCWHYLRMVALGSTAVYVAIAGAMLGFVFITFSFANLPYREVTVPLLTEEFLAATGYSMYRVVVPLMIAVLLAGKCGASAAADFGARRLTQQFEAMKSLNGRPGAYLYGALVLSLALGTPLLTIVAYASSCYAGLVAFLMSAPEATVAEFRRNFFATVLPLGQFWPMGTGWLALKSATTGILIAALAYHIGSRPKQSSVDVSRDVGLTIFWTSLSVLMLHALYSFVEF